jgi:glucose/arabinose dehydrogenase
MNVNGEKVELREVDVLPPEIWRQYEGKVIIFSEDEKRVIGVGDTEEKAFAQAEASGVGGLWHLHHAARWGVPQV